MSGKDVPDGLVDFDGVIEQLRMKLGGMAAALQKSGHALRTLDSAGYGGSASKLET